ncbi:MAG: hypothetical protein LBL54_01540 [Clostridiales Family XIII bacterium]|jgi:hypothetical protein|nr:hypothetical protein [Clostridiales Family XIII bacterium]
MAVGDVGEVDGLMEVLYCILAGVTVVAIVLCVTMAIGLKKSWKTICDRYMGVGVGDLIDVSGKHISANTDDVDVIRFVLTLRRLPWVAAIMTGAGVALTLLHDFNPIAPLLPWAHWFGIG